MSYNWPKAHMLLSGTFVVVVNGQTVFRKKKRGLVMVLILCVGAKTPGIPPSKVQWFSLLTTVVIARNCVRDKCSHCLNVQANK